MDKKNILITGGTGFIGSRLALKCIEAGHRVRIFGLINTAAEKNNLNILESHKAEIVLGAITEHEKLSIALEGIEVVFHLAAAQHEANIPDQVFYEVNVDGTRNLIELCIVKGIQRFIHGSTIGVYGDFTGEIDEDTPCHPSNIYGVTKLEGEKLVLSYKDNIPLVVIRISETYGPGDYRLLKLFRAINKKAFFKIGPGKNLHQLIYVDDLVSGFLKAAESERATGEIILLTGDTPITTENMINTIADSVGVILPAFRVPLFPFTIAAFVLESLLKPLGIQPPLHRRRMDFFKKSFSFKSTKAFNLLDFKPVYNFSKGASMTATWYKDNNMIAGNAKGAHSFPPPNIRIDTDLAAQIEPFDTFWEAPSDLEKGFGKFEKFYRRNYFKYMPQDKKKRALVISCGAGYLVESMYNEGYSDVIGIDSDSDKIEIAGRHGLNCHVANAFQYLRENDTFFDLIFAEQEINHLTKDEIFIFLDLCRQRLSKDGTLFVHSLNGANPITGSEALSQNINHFNTLTEYSLRQVLLASGFQNIRVFPLNLYIFFENPLNIIGMTLNGLLNILFRIGFIFYGKDNKLFSKKIAAVCSK